MKKKRWSSIKKISNYSAFFPGFMEKQFIMFFISEDPWQYIRNLKIPDELVILSGLRGLKRKKIDIETLIIADKFSWLSTHDNKFIVCSDLFEEGVKTDKINIPIPYLKGVIEKDYITIIRDKLNYHPLYYSRLPDGFVLAPRKEWITKIGYQPNIILDKTHVIMTQESMKLTSIDDHAYSSNVSSNEKDLIELFLQNIRTVFMDLQNKVREIYLIPSRSIGDLILMNLFNEKLKVIWPFKNAVPYFMKNNSILLDVKSILKKDKSILIKLRDKAESANKEILFISLLLETAKKTKIMLKDSLIVVGFGSNLDRVSDLIIALNDLFKATWPNTPIPILLSRTNIDLLKNNLLSLNDVTNYLNIEESNILEYQSYFDSEIAIINGY